MKYEVHIEETLCDTFEVEADSPEEAREIAEENYYSGEFVVGPNVTDRQISVEDGQWEEF